MVTRSPHERRLAHGARVSADAVRLAVLLARMPEGERMRREWLSWRPHPHDQRSGSRGRARPAGRETALPAPARYRRCRGIGGGCRNRRVHHRHGRRARECQGRGSGRRPSTRRPPTRTDERPAPPHGAGRCPSGVQPAPLLVGGLLCREPGNGVLPAMVGGDERRRVAARRHAALNQSAGPPTQKSKGPCPVRASRRRPQFDMDGRSAGSAS
jgi:hypothetical protein